VLCVLVSLSDLFGCTRCSPSGRDKPSTSLSAAAWAVGGWSRTAAAGGWRRGCCPIIRGDAVGDVCRSCFLACQGSHKWTGFELFECGCEATSVFLHFALLPYSTHGSYL
jgi:hypothetical protein